MQAERTKTPAGDGKERRIIVFGGDTRVHDVNSEAHDYGVDGLAVDTYEGDPTAAQRAAAAVVGGGVSDLVLTKWTGHAQAAVLIAACKRGETRLHRWQQSHHSLKGHLLNLVGIKARPAPMPVPLAVVHEEGFSNKFPKIELPADPPPPETPTPPPEEPTMAKKIRIDRAAVLEVFQMDAAKDWSAAEIADILGIVDPERKKNLYDVVARLVATGDVERVSGTPRSTTNPLRHRLKQATTLPTLAPSVTPSEGAWLVAIGETTRVFLSKEEALAEYGQRSDARLFKEVRVKWTLTIDE